MSSIFTRIVNGEIPCHRITENARFLAFLDVRPIAEGHTLVIPKQEVDYLFDLDDDTLGGLLVFARPVARALKAVIPCARVGVVVAGLEVPHAHVHLVPMTQMSDLSFTHAKPAEHAALAVLAGRIRANLQMA